MYMVSHCFFNPLKIPNTNSTKSMLTSRQSAKVLLPQVQEVIQLRRDEPNLGSSVAEIPGVESMPIVDRGALAISRQTATPDTVADIAKSERSRPDWDPPPPVARDPPVDNGLSWPQ